MAADGLVGIMEQLLKGPEKRVGSPVKTKDGVVIHPGAIVFYIVAASGGRIELGAVTVRTLGEQTLGGTAVGAPHVATSIALEDAYADGAAALAAGLALIAPGMFQPAPAGGRADG